MDELTAKVSAGLKLFGRVAPPWLRLGAVWTEAMAEMFISVTGGCGSNQQAEQTKARRKRVNE